MKNRNQFIPEASISLTLQSGKGLIVFLLLVVSMALSIYFIIKLSNEFATFSYIKFSGLLFVFLYGFYLLSRPDVLVSTRIAILSLIPIIDITLPPKRFDLTIFTVLLVICSIVLFIRALQKKNVIDLIPDKMVFILLLSSVPAVIEGFDTLHSAETFVIKIMSGYLFFVILYDYLSEENAFYDILKYLAYAMIIVALAIVFEFFTGINLSGEGKNVNALKGFTRCAGFFQDPQKAAQFLAVGIIFFMLLLCRNVQLGRKGSRLVVVSIILSVVALLLTASKNGIITVVVISIAAVIFYNQNKTIKHTFLFFLLPLSLMMVLLFQDSITAVFLESSVGARMTGITLSASNRIDIWHESWLAFQDHGNLITGVGPGNYQEMIMRADPGLRDAEAAGRFVPNQPESGYLKIFYETGLFGFLSLSLYLVGIVYKAAKSFFHPQQTVSTSIAASASFALVAFSFGFLTLFTVTDNRNLILFVIMYALLSFLQKNNLILKSHDE